MHCHSLGIYTVILLSVSVRVTPVTVSPPPGQANNTAADNLYIEPCTVRARPGRPRTLSVFHYTFHKSGLYGAFVWVCRARNGPTLRLPARGGQMMYGPGAYTCENLDNPQRGHVSYAAPHYSLDGDCTPPSTRAALLPSAGSFYQRGYVSCKELWPTTVSGNLIPLSTSPSTCS
jgi:hypothetical protein